MRSLLQQGQSKDDAASLGAKHAIGKTSLSRYEVDEPARLTLEKGDVIYFTSMVGNPGSEIEVSVTGPDRKTVRVKIPLGGAKLVINEAGAYSITVPQHVGLLVQDSRMYEKYPVDRRPKPEVKEKSKPNPLLPKELPRDSLRPQQQVDWSQILQREKAEPSDLEKFGTAFIERLTFQKHSYPDAWATTLADTIVDFTPGLGDAVGVVEAVKELASALEANETARIVIACAGIIIAIVAIIPAIGDVAKKILNWFLDWIGKRYYPAIKLAGGPAERGKQLRRAAGYEEVTESGDDFARKINPQTEQALNTLKKDLFEEGLSSLLPAQRKLVDRAKELNVRIEPGSRSVALPDQNVVFIDERTLLNDPPAAKKQALHELSHVVYHGKYAYTDNLDEIFLRELDANMYEGKSLDDAIYRVTRVYAVPQGAWDANRQINPRHIREYVRGLLARSDYRDAFQQVTTATFGY